MAGGRGERFWPQSRLKTPKHLLPIVGDEPMLTQTLERVQGVVPTKNIFIITNQDQVEGVLDVCPQLSPDQVIGEPVGRDTAAAVGLALTLIQHRNPEAVFAMLPADQVIKDHEGFVRILNAGFDAAKDNKVLVTIGIKPTFPATGYGYIHRGEPQLEYGGQTVYKVQRFVEKPALEKAKEYLESGDYYWNAGMFVWSVASIRDAFERFCPQLNQSLGVFAEGLKSEQPLEKLLAEHYPKFEKISIDYAIMEKAQNVVTIESCFDWDDVGSWLAIERHESQDTEGNVKRGQVVMKDCRNNIAVGSSGHVLALLGVDDLIVVQTPDATLICPKNKAEEIKEMVKAIGSDTDYTAIL